MLSKYVWLLPLLASMCLIYSNEYLKIIKLNFVNDWLNTMKNAYGNGNIRKSNLVSNANVKHEMFTAKELEKYTNLEDGLYISILGQIFDVTKGAKHYGPGASYHAFTGRDATLAFVTGKFDDKGLTDDISSLSTQQIKALNDWVQFYHKNYIYIGKLNGRYYNEDGTPTRESHTVQKMLGDLKGRQLEEEYRKKMFPPCNIEWKPDSGTVVWCTKRSGGIERDWSGVPRMLFESPSSKEYRCACVNLNSKEYEETKGMLREYFQCPKTSIKCAVKTENL